MPLALKEQTALASVLIGLAALPILTACGMCIYFGIYKTHHLQTEDYQVRRETLDMIRQKGGKIVVEPADLIALANPAVKRIASSDVQEET